jgi:LPPG:FO 2-phospho-L-lactate transferase
MKVTALAGGVGGAKLADGLSRLGESLDLTVIVNTGDDFLLFGLQICPDLDTVCYNLAGLENPQTGWGRDQESWNALQEIRSLEGPDWFQLGDKDLGTHLERTRRLKEGQKLSQITADFCFSWGIGAAVLPMSDDPRPTFVETDRGVLPFQDYFVRHRCQPAVQGFIFQGAEDAAPAPGVLEAISEADLIVICPSNPWVSIDPILAVPGIRNALEESRVLGLSPLIGGTAVKGPAAKMYREMGVEPSAAAVAAHYGRLLDGFIIDNQDRALANQINEDFGGVLQVFTEDILMKSREERIRLAGQVIDIGKDLVKEI